MATAMKEEIRQIIDCAIKLLEEKGWTKGYGALVRQASGKEIRTDVFDENANAYCVIGALARCAFTDRVSLIWRSTDCTYEKICQHAFSDLGESIQQWNDDPDRTFDHVIAKLQQWKRELTT